MYEDSDDDMIEVDMEKVNKKNASTKSYMDINAVRGWDVCSDASEDNDDGEGSREMREMESTDNMGSDTYNGGDGGDDDDGEEGEEEEEEEEEDGEEGEKGVKMDDSGEVGDGYDPYKSSVMFSNLKEIENLFPSACSIDPKTQTAPASASQVGGVLVPSRIIVIITK
jgi:hypothetical protein